MTAYGRIFLAGAGSVAILLGALAFQYIGGLAPCPMCIWQRWPHLAAILIALLAMTVLWRRLRPLAALGALSMAVGAGLGLFHAGVEQGWWEGPGGCVAPQAADLPADALLDQILATEVVRCDEIVWSFLGLSMAAWNAVISAGLMLIWLWSTLPQPPQPVQREG